MIRQLCGAGLLGLVSLAMPVCADSPAEKLLSVTYDISRLMKGPGIFEAKDPDGMVENIVQLVVSTIRPAIWRGQDAKHTMQVVGGTRLQIHTTQQNHEEIADLLAALQRLVDLAVVMDCGLYEVERGFYEKALIPALAKAGNRPVLPLDAKLTQELSKAAKLAKSEKVKIVNGDRARFFSWRHFLFYDGAVAKGKERGLATASHGLSCEAHVIVSADRQRVRLRITQNATDLLEVRKETLIDPQTGQKTTVETPDFRKVTTTTAVEAADGQPLLLPVQMRSLQAAAKDRVLVLVVRPLIHDEEEEKLRDDKE